MLRVRPPPDLRRAENKFLRATAAWGYGELLAAAATPQPRATALAARLEQQSFFSSSPIATFMKPDGQTRAVPAIALIKKPASLAGLAASEKRRLWPQAVAELGACSRLLDSPPRLFTEVLILDGLSSWGLTPQ